MQKPNIFLLTLLTTLSGQTFSAEKKLTVMAPQDIEQVKKWHEDLKRLQDFAAVKAAIRADKGASGVAVCGPIMTFVQKIAPHARYEYSSAQGGTFIIHHGLNSDILSNIRQQNEGYKWVPNQVLSDNKTTVLQFQGYKTLEDWLTHYRSHQLLMAALAEDLATQRQVMSSRHIPY